MDTSNKDLIIVNANSQIQNNKNKGKKVGGHPLGEI